FGGALDLVAKQHKKDASKAKVTCAVSIGPREGGGFGLEVRLQDEDRSLGRRSCARWGTKPTRRSARIRTRPAGTCASSSKSSADSPAPVPTGPHQPGGGPGQVRSRMVSRYSPGTAMGPPGSLIWSKRLTRSMNSRRSSAALAGPAASMVRIIGPKREQKWSTYASAEVWRKMKVRGRALVMRAAPEKSCARCGSVPQWSGDWRPGGGGL